jgi:hypothetical protein
MKPLICFKGGSRLEVVACSPIVAVTLDYDRRELCVHFDAEAAAPAREKEVSCYEILDGDGQWLYSSATFDPVGVLPPLLDCAVLHPPNPNRVARAIGMATLAAIAAAIGIAVKVVDAKPPQVGGVDLRRCS